jgi:hypothetical protein
MIGLMLQELSTLNPRLNSAAIATKQWWAEQWNIVNSLHHSPIGEFNAEPADEYKILKQVSGKPWALVR